MRLKSTIETGSNPGIVPYLTIFKLRKTLTKLINLYGFFSTAIKIPNYKLVGRTRKTPEESQTWPYPIDVFGYALGLEGSRKHVTSFIIYS